jgi:hypothetical protein
LPVCEALAVPSITWHSAVYWLMKPGSHAPLAKPFKHVHLYALVEMVEFVDESSQAAPFAHGLLAHSLTSSLQVPPVFTLHFCAIGRALSYA